MGADHSGSKSQFEAATQEQRIQERGQALLAAMRERRSGRDTHWLDQLFERLMADDTFRVRVLRFVDVLPVLETDADVVSHLREYFPANDFPLPGLAKWGLKLGSGKLGARLLAMAVNQSMGLVGTHFLGGTTADEVLKTVAALRRQGLCFSLDLLGEESVSEAEADDYLQRYLELVTKLSPSLAAWDANPLLDSVNDRPAPRLNLSLKLSSLYSQSTPRDLEGSVSAMAERLRPLLRAARKQGAFIFLDMEHYDLKDVILSALRTVLKEEEFRDWPDVGIALQAYLRDTEQDLAELALWAEERGTPVTVRLVRGAYWDQECIIARCEGWPVPVWTQKCESDACYERCLERLMAAHPHLEAAIATHNIRSVAVAMELAQRHGLEAGQYEFQTLFGMGQILSEAIAAMGQRVRVYTPFGELLPGMAYLVRRLLENSSSQSFVSMLSQAKQEDEARLLAPPESVVALGPSEQSGSHQGFSNEPVRRYVAASERQGFATALQRVRTQLDQTYPLLIGGERRDSGRYIVSLNPAHPSEVVGRVASANQADADAALAAAEKAFTSWSARPAAERVEFLRRAAAALRAQRDEFAAWMVLEAGKPWAEADADVAEAIDFLDYYAEEALRLVEPQLFHLPGETNAMGYRARGVGVVIPPWNFPLAILTGMLAAAVVTGNTVILKPSSQTPVIAARFVALLQQLDLPTGVVNFLPGPGGEVGEYLVCHPRIHFIAFTGSQQIGTRIARLANELAPGQAHIKRVIAEMGGKNAVIVDRDADPDVAVRGIVRSAFGYAGQKCSACSRVILVGKGQERFVERLVEATRSLRLGDPAAAGTFVGPVIEAAARDRIRKAIEQGKETAQLALQMDGANLGEGYYVGPTIFTGVEPGSMLAQEEIFGPVLAVLRAADFDEALRLANGTAYALTGGVFSRSPANLEKARRSFQVGNLYLNRGITGARVGHQPFGGFRLSGMGSKAGGPDYLLQFVESQVVTENTLRKGYAPDS